MFKEMQKKKKNERNMKERTQSITLEPMFSYHWHQIASINMCRVYVYARQKRESELPIYSSYLKSIPMMLASYRDIKIYCFI